MSRPDSEGFSLTAAAMSELRHRYRRTKIAEFVNEICIVGRTCFAGAHHFAEKLGLCDRTIFRYFKVLKVEGQLERIPGSREPRYMPEKADYPGKLRSHGYAITRFRGDLAHLVGRSYGQSRSNVERRDERKRSQWKARGEREAKEKREAVADFLSSLSPVAVQAAMQTGVPPMPPAKREPKPAVPSPYAWGEREAQQQLELARSLLGEPTGPPD